MATVVIPIKELTQFDLPAVCVVTGSRENVTFQKVQFAWVPMAARLAVVLCGLVGIVAMLVMQKRVQGELPFSEAGWQRYRSGKILTVVGVLGFIGLALLGALTLSARMGALGVIILLASLAVLLGAVLAARGRGPVCKRIEDDDIELELPSAEATEAFEQRLRGAAAIAPVATASASASGSPDAPPDEAVYDEKLDDELRRF